jgi:hypothetical protein
MKKNILLILSIIIVSSFGCERDDICAATTQTTPSLVIEAVNEDDPTQSLNVQNLRIQGVGNDAPLFFVLQEDGIPEEINTFSTIVLPLRTDIDSTMYVLHTDFTLGEDGTVGGNPDTITVKYTREDRFISRACGFSTVYNDVTIAITEDDDPWIVQIRAENDNQIIENEAEPHFTLLH